MISEGTNLQAYKMKRVHFHSFDAFRFFSFLLVFFHHLPKTGSSYIDFFLKSGGVGVSFFFVLSGFLITYILLHEKQLKGTISLKTFFARRILRIWPLFYLMIAFAYLSPYLLDFLGMSASNLGYKPDLLTSLVFGENYKMMISNTFPAGAPVRVMWSLCIEEHFYIIWGLAFFFIPSKQVPKLILFSILIANLVRPVFSHFNLEHLDLFSNFDYFAYGSIPAYLLMFKQSALKKIESIPIHWKYTFLIFTCATVFILPNLKQGWMEMLEPTILGLLFATTILLTLGKNAIHISDDSMFGRLGKYTYSLYLFHTILILLMLQVFNKFGLSNWLLIGIFSLVATVLCSILSFHCFEKQFLKWKKYF